MLSQKLSSLAETMNIMAEEGATASPSFLRNAAFILTVCQQRAEAMETSAIASFITLPVIGIDEVATNSAPVIKLFHRWPARVIPVGQDPNGGDAA